MAKRVGQGLGGGSSLGGGLGARGDGGVSQGLGDGLGATEDGISVNLGLGGSQESWCVENLSDILVHARVRRQRFGSKSQKRLSHFNCPIPSVLELRRTIVPTVLSLLSHQVGFNHGERRARQLQLILIRNFETLAMSASAYMAIRSHRMYLDEREDSALLDEKENDRRCELEDA
ncbi:hypothetical protein E2562_000788 [Oryza meyeriana var. granulata]|uniref:Uncharacterized protein n=1 Tax=Oryza meyeriana var. granulata TaxID=110450 RepID=A0A6G1DUU7_9ORYZ|nr:hypothetical protein E2562_000788 [Oryza meyeriana var. granulata]